VRAVSKALDIDWNKAKMLLDVYSMDEAEVETSDLVWSRILSENGFQMIPLYCNNRCTLYDFCKKNPVGVFVVKVSNHVVCVVDGCYYDSWDSGKEIPLYCWRK